MEEKHKNVAVYIMGIVLIVMILTVVGCYIYKVTQTGSFENMKVVESWKWTNGVQEKTLALGEKGGFIFKEKKEDGTENTYQGTYKNEDNQIKIKINSASTDEITRKEISFKKEDQNLLYTDEQETVYVFQKETVE